MGARPAMAVPGEGVSVSTRGDGRHPSDAATLLPAVSAPGATEVREGRHAPLREEPPRPSSGAANHQSVPGPGTATATGRHPAAVPRARGQPPGDRELADTLLVPGARGGGDLEARPVPPAPHVRDRGARRRGIDVRVVAGDGHLARDDRHPLRAPRSRLGRLDSGASRRQIRIILAFIWRPTPSDRTRRRAAIPHEDRDRG